MNQMNELSKQDEVASGEITTDLVGMILSLEKKEKDEASD